MVHRGVDQDRLERQARELFQQAGVACLAVADRQTGAKLRIETNLSAKRSADRRFYFRSKASAAKVLHEISTIVPLLGAGTNDVAEARVPSERIAAVIHDCASRVGVLLTDEAAFQTLLQAWSRKLGAAFVQMQASGALRDLNQCYRRDRLSGTKMPPYDTWVASKVSAKIDLAHLGF